MYRVKFIRIEGIREKGPIFLILLIFCTRNFNRMFNSEQE